MKFVFRNVPEINYNDDILYSPVYDLKLSQEIISKLKFNNNYTGEEISNTIVEFMNRGEIKSAQNNKYIILFKEIAEKYNKWYFKDYTK
tara:strand:+ start:302 stop:568 length:267 start_codon:yes stop_codon:yes gene_type:complete